MFELSPFVRRANRMSCYDPFHEWNEFEKNFLNGAENSFHTDVREEENGYLVEADLPGFKKEDIHVDVEGDTLVVSAERHSESENKDEKNNYVRRERSYGKFTRCFDITGVDSDKITVGYTDGVLTLNLPKKTQTLPNTRRLEIE